MRDDYTSFRPLAFYRFALVYSANQLSCFNIVQWIHSQECNSNRVRAWTDNNSLTCSDNNVTTRDDRCSNGECRGQPFTCLPCQDHRNDICQIKTGHCVINYNNGNTCFTATTEKPGNPCQVE
jgi:hypothetical protein